MKLEKDTVLNIQFYNNGVTITFKDNTDFVYDCGFYRSPKGKEQLIAKCDEETIEKVLEVWGDNLLEDIAPPVLPEPIPQPTAEQLAILDLTEQTVDNDYRISVLELGL